MPVTGWGSSAVSAVWGKPEDHYSSSLWSTDPEKQLHFQRFIHSMFKQHQKFVFRKPVGGGWQGALS